jgi:hypothetical protein
VNGTPLFLAPRPLSSLELASTTATKAPLPSERGAMKKICSWWGKGVHMIALAVHTLRTCAPLSTLQRIQNGNLMNHNKPLYAL